MTQTERTEWRTALTKSAPIAMGYLPIGVGLGALVVNSGLPPWLAPLSALLILAGSMEFLLVGLILSGASLIEIALATLLVNFRHVFYPLAYPRFPGRFPLVAKVYSASTLTDETYAVINANTFTSRQELIKVQVLGHAYWVTGALIGAYLFGLVPESFKGMDFAMASLFIVLTLQMTGTSWAAISPATRWSLALGVIGSAAAALLAPSTFLLFALSFVAIGALALHLRGKEAV